MIHEGLSKLISISSSHISPHINGYDPFFFRVVSDMSKCRIVAGALVEGDGEDVDGNAGTWIQLVLMLEEVRAL